VFVDLGGLVRHMQNGRARTGQIAAAGTGRWLVAKVNTEEVPEVAAQFQIRGTSA
jgi:hypothetical protein